MQEFISEIKSIENELRAQLPQAEELSMWELWGVREAGQDNIEAVLVIRDTHKGDHNQPFVVKISPEWQGKGKHKRLGFAINMAMIQPDKMNLTTDEGLLHYREILDELLSWGKSFVDICRTTLERKQETKSTGGTASASGNLETEVKG